MKNWLSILASTVFGLALWQAVVTLTAPPSYILPAPWDVAETLWTARGQIAHHSLYTMGEVLLGLVLGAALGALSAIGLASSPLAQTLLRPMMVFSQAIPVFVLAPILTLWLGYGIWPKVIMALLIIYFPVTSAFFDALMRTPVPWLDLAQVMGANRRRVMWHIRIPAALPGLASGLRLAAVYAPIGVIISEWVGASQGLGYLILLALGRVKVDLMFATTIALAVFTLLTYAAVDRFCRHWLDAPAE
ncbi:ABC transporter permease [uncultured Roseovarius sp.]|uniref:ABC transporter permease n=1 Tax=uncultured Roseovarius sp. TaxID=293344 RepID=UPI00259973F6|nr:ABC transporter permease [uncultured Roseovarius sp.]